MLICQAGDTQVTSELSSNHCYTTFHS